MFSTNFHDDIHAFQLEASNQIVKEAAAAKSTSQSISVLHYTSHRMRSAMQKGVIPKNPAPTIDSADVIPLICELKAKLTAIESKLYRTNGARMKAHLGALLSELDCTDLDNVIESLCGLNDIVNPSKKLFPVYERYLNFDRIVSLCAKQYRLFFTAYLESQPDGTKKVQQALDQNTRLLNSLLVYGPLNHNFDVRISRETMEELLQSVLPYLAWYIPRELCACCTFRGYDFEAIYYLMSNIVLGVDDGIDVGDEKIEDDTFDDDEMSNTVAITANQICLLTAVLGLLRNFIQDSLKIDADPSTNCLNIDALAHLIEKLPHFNGHYTESAVHSKQFIYEICAAFELLNDCPQLLLKNKAKILSSLKVYILSIMRQLGPEVALHHFELAAIEMKRTEGRTIRQVVLFLDASGYGELIRADKPSKPEARESKELSAFDPPSSSLKETILIEVQKLQAEMVKSQQMINELMQKLDNQ